MAWHDFNQRVKIYELSPLALLFQFQTGVRIGEVCTLRYEDIETENYIHCQRMLQRDTGLVLDHTKTECGDREIYLTPKAKKIIAEAKQRQKDLGVDSEGYIFSHNGEPLKHSPINDLYRKYCRKLQTYQKSSHKARKTYISALIDGQVNINTIREMAGHAEEKTTYGNYAFDRKTKAERNLAIENALLS